jgi:phosphatidylglycerol:prolipoprotein diacylglycerol transferase
MFAPQFDPVAFHLGPLAVHWYGLSYLAAFSLFLWLGRLRLKHPSFSHWQTADLDNLLFWGSLGVILGGRLGYCLFYQPTYYLHHPVDIVKIWTGGMSFHGGFLGVCIATSLFAKSRQRPVWEVLDFIAPCVPTGLAMGRLGNFINGELWGRVASPTLPWAMIFPQSGLMEPRHPSQLYEFGLEGMLLFTLLWIYAKHIHLPGKVSCLFLMGYGVLRFVVEYFREPDAFLGILYGLSMGQWLSLPMIGLGILGWFVLGSKRI